jgi:hypothetical protein
MEAQGSSPLTLGDQNDVMALLKLPARLREIQLTVTAPQLRKINTLMQRAFSQLESLFLTTADGLVLPSEFGGSTRGIVGGAVQAQSMTTVIEGEAVFTHGNRRWHLVKGAVCQDVIEEATPSTTRKGPSGTRSQKL